MYTISLTDEAYQRLQDWKESTTDSFSTVVLEVVPRKEPEHTTLDLSRRSPAAGKTAFIAV